MKPLVCSLWSGAQEPGAALSWAKHSSKANDGKSLSGTEKLGFGLGFEGFDEIGRCFPISFAQRCPLYTEIRRLWKVKPTQGNDLLELHILFDECYLLSGMGLN